MKDIVFAGREEEPLQSHNLRVWLFRNNLVIKDIRPDGNERTYLNNVLIDEKFASRTKLNGTHYLDQMRDSYEKMFLAEPIRMSEEKAKKKYGIPGNFELVKGWLDHQEIVYAIVSREDNRYLHINGEEVAMTGTLSVNEAGQYAYPSVDWTLGGTGEIVVKTDGAGFYAGVDASDIQINESGSVATVVRRLANSSGKQPQEVVLYLRGSQREEYSITAPNVVGDNMKRIEELSESERTTLEDSIMKEVKASTPSFWGERRDILRVNLVPDQTEEGLYAKLRDYSKK